MGLPFIHVFDVPEFEKYRRAIIGHTNVPDDEIADYCGETHRTLIAFDSDFRGKWVRAGVLEKANVEVIVLPQVPSLEGQLLRVAECYPHWRRELSRNPYGFRVWEHDRRSRVPHLRRR